VTICGRCESQTRHHLSDQEAHRKELMTALTRMTRMQAPNDGGRATNLALAWARMGDRFLESIGGKELQQIIATLPPARRAADALHSQRSLLVAWCRDLAEVYDIPLPQNTIAAMSGHLGRHMRILRKHPAGGEFVAEIRALVAKMIAAVDLPKTRSRFPVGLCPETFPGDDGPEECPGKVEAVIPAEEHIRPVMECGHCRTQWFSEQWARAGALILRRSERAS
jgi:hypothetical protein